MAVKIRLKRFGRNHRSIYRISAIDSRRPRDGRVLEEVGVYDPQNKDAAQQVRLNAERISYWISKGATPSDTVRSLLNRQGVKLS